MYFITFFIYFSVFELVYLSPRTRSVHQNCKFVYLFSVWQPCGKHGPAYVFVNHDSIKPKITKVTIHTTHHHLAQSWHILERSSPLLYLHPTHRPLQDQYPDTQVFDRQSINIISSKANIQLGVVIQAQWLLYVPPRPKF